MKPTVAEKIKPMREVRSYVIRSRMTPNQRMGFEHFWSEYGISHPQKELNFAELYPSPAPIILEIGFGMGGSLVQLASRNPSINFLGIEVHKPGIGSLLAAINDQKLTNIRVVWGDAIGLLEKFIPDNSLMGVLLFFPDPWPKRRHNKRRIVQSSFVNLVHQKLSSIGYFHLATDVKEYAVHMMQVINSHSGFTINEKVLMPESLIRPKTKFEQRGESLGHSITDLIFTKI